MKILLGKAVLFENQAVNAQMLLLAREFEVKQIKSRFLECNLILGRWEGNKSKYVIYAVQDLGDLSDMDVL